MGSGPLGTLLARLRHAGDPAAMTDVSLLERFVRGRDEEAFRALVARHGPMVLGVCRRVLRHDHDADDAFQATFLILARKAGTVRRASVGGWLHRVALRAALAARGRALTTVGQLDRVAAPDPASARDEFGPLLDEEVRRLPEKYRRPIVLCYLEGRTHEEAAAELGWPKGTVAGRLARARDLLRRRLERRGVTMSAVGLAVAVPEALAGAAASERARALAGEVLNTMLKMRIMVIGIVLLALVGLVGGAALAKSGAGDPEGGARPAAADGPAKAPEPVVKDGLAISLRPVKDVFPSKETPRVEVRLKNVSDKAFWLCYPGGWQYPARTFLIEDVKTGKRWTWAHAAPDDSILLTKELKPGESLPDTAELMRFLGEIKGGERLPDQERLSPGKYRVRVTVRLSQKLAKRGEGARSWTGEITSDWAEFAIAETPAKGKDEKKPKVDPNLVSVRVFAPSGWYWELQPDGSGVCGYGSGAQDLMVFPEKTFNFEAIVGTITAQTKPDGNLRTHYGVALYRKGVVSTGTVYFKDEKLVAGLFDGAYNAAVQGDHARIDEIWEKMPPTPLNVRKKK